MKTPIAALFLLSCLSMHAIDTTLVTHLADENPLTSANPWGSPSRSSPQAISNMDNLMTGPVNIDGEDAWEILDIFENDNGIAFPRVIYTSGVVGGLASTFLGGSWHARFRMKGLTTDDDTIGYLNSAFRVSMVINNFGIGTNDEYYDIGVWETAAGTQGYRAGVTSGELSDGFHTFEMIYRLDDRLDGGSGVSFYIDGQLVQEDLVGAASSNFGNQVSMGDLLGDNITGGGYWAESFFAYDPEDPTGAAYSPVPEISAGSLFLGIAVLVFSLKRRRS